MRGILDFISNICPITGDNVIDTLLFAVIAGFSFFVAWKLTGDTANFFGLHDSNGMSALHWIIRFVIFFLLLTIILGIVNFICWVGSWPWWGYLILGIVIINAIAGAILIVVFKKKKKCNKASGEQRL